MTQEQKDKLHKNKTSWFTDVNRSKVSNKLIQPFYDLNPERNVFDKDKVYFKNEKIEVAPTSNAIILEPPPLKMKSEPKARISFVAEHPKNHKNGIKSYVHTHAKFTRQKLRKKALD